jgi:hypothetical protein
VYLLKGLIKCGVCGRAYAGMVQTYRPWYRYYLCTRRHPYAQQDGTLQRCTNKAVRGEGVDDVVWTTVRDLLVNDHSLAEQLRSWLERTTADATASERTRLATGRLNELKHQRGRLIDAYQSGVLDLEEFRKRKTTVEERILTVEHELAELRSWASKRELAARQVAGAEAVVKRLRQQLEDPSFETKQAILRLVLDKVIVVGRRLELHLALPVSGGFGLTCRRRARRGLFHKRGRSGEQPESQERPESPRFDASVRSPVRRGISSIGPCSASGPTKLFRSSQEPKERCADYGWMPRRPAASSWRRRLMG